MKHENPKGKDHRSEETKQRDRDAAADEHAHKQRKLPDVNLDAGGEASHSGRNSARTAAQTRRTERR